MTPTTIRAETMEEEGRSQKAARGKVIMVFPCGTSIPENSQEAHEIRDRKTWGWPGCPPAYETPKRTHDVIDSKRKSRDLVCIPKACGAWRGWEAE